MRIAQSIQILLILALSCGYATSRNYIIDVFASEEISPLRHFWESTGMCPPLPHDKAADYFLSQDMLQNIAFIGTVPHDGIEQVRMHWLLDMVTYNKATDEYDFSKLDALLQLLNKYGLKPGFELMGNPSQKFSDFDDDKQVLDWMKLVTDIGNRYVKMFGLSYLSTWNFETWNEPDHHDFDNVNMSVEGFLKYYDACSEGLKAVSNTLIFGGPGGSCRKESFSKRCWALLSHCVDGKNYITGKNGSRIDYISIHKKGGGKADYILETERETYTKIHSTHPSLKKTPIYNDEGDPMVGWSTPYFWRADATYPGIVAKVITEHQYEIVANNSDVTNYNLLSNDNGFLSYSPHYFTQRTLSARFQMNNTKPHYVHLVRKPIYALMGLLAKLGDTQLNANVHDISNYFIGAIASKCDMVTCASPELTVLIYASADAAPLYSVYDISLNIIDFKSVFGASNESVMFTKCEIHNLASNPYKIWLDAGRPNFPCDDLFRKMHHALEPSCTKPTKVNFSSGNATLNSELLLPGVMLYHFCQKPPTAPAAPKMISVLNITSGQVIVSWSDKKIRTKCIQTYEIELCANATCATPRKLNQHKVTFNSFVYISASRNDANVIGFYRVRVQDFWNRYSAYSDLLQYPK